jgi:hypothetical protein
VTLADRAVDHRTFKPPISSEKESPFLRAWREAHPNQRAAVDGPATQEGGEAQAGTCPGFQEASQG